MLDILVLKCMFHNTDRKKEKNKHNYIQGDREEEANQISMPT